MAAPRTGSKHAVPCAPCRLNDRLVIANRSRSAPLPDLQCPPVGQPYSLRRTRGDRRHAARPHAPLSILVIIPFSTTSPTYRTRSSKIRLEVPKIVCAALCVSRGFGKQIVERYAVFYTPSGALAVLGGLGSSGTGRWVCHSYEFGGHRPPQTIKETAQIRASCTTQDPLTPRPILIGVVPQPIVLEAITLIGQAPGGRFHQNSRSGLG